MSTDFKSQMTDAPVDLVCQQHKNKPEKRLACNLCLQEQQNINVQDYEAKEKKKRCENTDIIVGGESLEYAKNLEKNIDSVMEKINDYFESMKEIVQKLTDSLRSEREKNLKYSFFEELEIYIQTKDQSTEENEKVKQIRSKIINQFGKLKRKLETFPSNLEKMSENVLKKTQEFYRRNYDELNKPLNLDLITTVKQRDPCYTLTFNSEFLFTGCGKQIKVWNFNQGNMQEHAKLNGHALSVTRIVTSSKVKNSFISAAECGSLIIWKQKNEKEWEFLKKPAQWTNCIVLNKNETELILASANCEIDFWSVDFNQNQLIYNYSLENTHQNTIFDLTLNKKENKMVTCGADNKILIWTKDDQAQKWKFVQEINQITYGTKVAFISDDQFVWMGCDQKTNDQIFFFKSQRDGKFENNQQKAFQLDIDEEQYVDYHLNPITYNQLQKVFLVRFKRHIYIIKITDADLQIVTKQKFDTNLIFATLSNDGKYLIAYVEDLKRYQIREIKW
ncbi:unnamed protein product (macronuclear) [Paramecium tetraurelia]|uniref:Uncharacterized protein n=1 Tax=Paramecium tetraurelia TaxID=5888 RepID=A0CZ38_PARTE|nr:uncharacterized protein GSPATT00011656001 [Paramecium tetraurelia]CAK76055.1 unnamed protein product [Paramecium tetraurelia]|eukprot:XP_001443452.1 hypothetical protein (macronuclear) [Paramecium tetraurelia strain d4-2]